MSADNCTLGLDSTIMNTLPYIVIILTTPPCWLAIALNGTIIFIFLRPTYHALRQWSDWLILNIAMGDFLMALDSIPSLYVYTTYYWCFASVSEKYGFSVNEMKMINIIDTIRNFGGFVSNFTMTLLSIARFRAAVLLHDIDNDISLFQAIYRSAIIYTISIVYISTHFMYTDPQYDIIHEWLAAVLTAILPLTIITVMYTSLAYKLWYGDAITFFNVRYKRRRTAFFRVICVCTFHLYFSLYGTSFA